MFNVNVKVSEKDLGTIIRLLETNVQVHNLEITYIKRGTNTPRARNRPKQTSADHLSTSETLVFGFFKARPNDIFHRDQIGRFLQEHNYSKGSASPIMSHLHKRGKITRVSNGRYSYQTGKLPHLPSETPEIPVAATHVIPEGENIVEVIDNIVDADNSY